MQHLEVYFTDSDWCSKLLLIVEDLRMLELRPAGVKQKHTHTHHPYTRMHAHTHTQCLLSFFMYTVIVTELL